METLYSFQQGDIALVFFNFNWSSIKILEVLILSRILPFWTRGVQFCRGRRISSSKLISAKALARFIGWAFFDPSNLIQVQCHMMILQYAMACSTVAGN
ncbi:hypothetical protein DID88_005011 [Monilinia fructigena]|uniref:Uncharacterized protein n=1 Tax=Monilinia fructigena TaxID=38457 RepID=A0A395IQ62_9HELO|nr:hypothetical protein DID88_005011 [Monilinia fructigena]